MTETKDYNVLCRPTTSRSVNCMNHLLWHVQAEQRRNELQKMRALMSYHEQKCRRTKKIKSKKYANVL